MLTSCYAAAVAPESPRFKIAKVDSWSFPMSTSMPNFTGYPIPCQPPNSLNLRGADLAAQCEIPPHIAQYPFEIVSERGVSHPFALFS